MLDMSAVGQIFSVATRVRHTGYWRTVNRCPGTWSAVGPHKVPLRQVWQRARPQQFAIYRRTDRRIWD